MFGTVSIIPGGLEQFLYLNNLSENIMFLNVFVLRPFLEVLTALARILLLWSSHTTLQITVLRGNQFSEGN